MIASYYNGMYRSLAQEYDDQKMRWARRSAKGYLAVLAKHGHHDKKHLLDLGGGLGYYTKAFEEMGLATTLVEQDPVSVRFARDVLNIKHIVESNTDDFFENNREKYELVFLRHVIEHVTSPAKLISSIAHLVADKGILIIETDNNAGVELLFRPETARFYLHLYKQSFSPSSFYKLLTLRPFAVDPPRHLFGFRISNLSQLLEKNSLLPFQSVCYRLGHPVYWPNLPHPNLRTISSDVFNLRLKSAFFNIIDLGLLPVRLLLEYKNLASGIAIYAEKKG